MYLTLVFDACHPQSTVPLVGNPAPGFTAQAVFDQEFMELSLSQYKVRPSFQALIQQIKLHTYTHHYPYSWTMPIVFSATLQLHSDSHHSRSCNVT